MKKISIRELTLISVFSALMIAAQVALSALPNIEAVSILVIVATLMLGWRVIYVLTVFVFAEGFIYGFAVWWFCYLYIWAILAFAAFLFRKNREPITWALISGVFGLLFGTLCSPVYYFTLDYSGWISWMIANIPYDVVHGVSNFIIAFVLFKPLMRVCDRFKV